jgi:threonine 3-dehydrogenase
MLAEFEVELVFHLAALLSTRSEFTPVMAHQVNVEGTLNLLEFAQHEGESHGRPVVFLYPSSIAAYGLPTSRRSAKAGRVKEDEWLHPTTMYGCNKLYCEQLGNVLRAALQAARGRAGERQGGLPLRAVPGADLGADRPVGGDVGLRARDDPRGRQRGAVRLLRAAGHADPVHGDARRGGGAARAREAPRERALAHGVQRRRVQPVRGRDRSVVVEAFPGAQITWETDVKRQGIVDSWPADVDDSAARRDWGFAPRYDFTRAFSEST